MVEEPVIEPAENLEDIQAGPPVCETCDGEPVEEEPAIEEPQPENIETFENSGNNKESVVE